MFTCFDLSLFLLADTSSPALENKLSAGRVTCHVKYRYKPILILSIDTSSSDASIGNTDTSSPALENNLSAGRVTCHMKYRYKPILILSIDTSSSDTSIGNIDILASVSPITINSHTV